MNYALEAVKLADYITQLDEKSPIIQYRNNRNNLQYNHLGALITDCILQSGLNYRTVVLPRVNYVLNNFKDANTLSGFCKEIDRITIENVILWTHPQKIDRIYSLINFLKIYKIENCDSLRSFLLIRSNQKKFLNIKGIGPKTLDYVLKLLNCDVIAVDRHISTFVSLANINSSNYYETKKIVEYAADFLEISRGDLDYTIWYYMANLRGNSYNYQFEFSQ